MRFLIFRQTSLMLLVLPVLLVLLSGCLNLHNAKYFENNENNKTQSDSLVRPPDNSSLVVFISESSVVEKTSFIPAAASIGFLANDYLLTQMPRGSYTKLIVNSGNVDIKVANLYGSKKINGIHIFESKKFNFESGKIYFISSRLTFGKGIHLVQLTEEEGLVLVKKLPLAKTLHTRIHLSAIHSNKSSNRSSSQNNSSDSSRDVVVPTNDFSISKDAVSDFFAVAGAVAIAALFIFGLGMAISAGASSYVPPSVPPDRPSINIVQSQPLSVRSASGEVFNLNANKSDGTIINRSTGVRYQIEGDFITGTDGSRYRSAGSTIFSNTGNYYTKSGNVITSNDGRQCQIIGELIDCK